MGFLDFLRGQPQPKQRPATEETKVDDQTPRAAARELGSVDGRHYTESVETVKQLKRDGRLEEAVALLLRLCDAAEREARAQNWPSPAPWYYEQLAIVYRKQGNYAAEVGILERYGTQVHSRRGVRAENSFAERLEKARALLAASNTSVQSFCPYCGVEIVPTPKSSRKCPTCGERVIVAKRAGEEIPSLLTVEQAEQNKRLIAESRQRKKVLDRARKLGCSEADVDVMDAELTAKWGRPPSLNDLVWALTNKQVLVAGGRGDWGWLSRIYQVQGDVLQEEGKSTIEADQRAQDMLLHYYEGVCAQVALPAEVVVSSRKACCPACAELSGSVVPIARAKAERILPNPGCTHPRCRCMWRVDYGPLRDQPAIDGR